MTNTLITQQAVIDGSISDPALSKAINTMDVVVAGFPERCADETDQASTQEQMRAAWTVIRSRLDLPTINSAWTVLTEEPGTIGVLYDPHELANLLDYVDHDNTADMDALTAWCEQESDYLRDAMCNVIYSNLPGRGDIDEALAKQLLE